MDYLPIYDYLVNNLKARYSNRHIRAHIGGSWHCYRYIQISTPIDDPNIHYEYRHGYVELHFEDKAVANKQLVDYLIRKTEGNKELHWLDWDDSIAGINCQWGKYITNEKELHEELDKVINTFDRLISEYQSTLAVTEESYLEQEDRLPKQDQSVDIYTLTTRRALELPLSLPEYQRIYCWEEHSVKCLLDDICNHMEKPEYNSTAYRLGSIILHRHDGKYDIIDGQQRLVTLSLLLQCLGVNTGLLQERFGSSKAREFLAYNKFLIKSYLEKHAIDKCLLAKTVLDNLEFSVLVLQNTSLDLAYTFFSNENSRGVVLTDYDLLKAHHLRFIPLTFEQQSKKAAENWNNMIESGRKQIQKNDTPDYERTLDTYMYRLRRWMRNEDSLEGNDDRRVKREYEAAPIIDEIPPFGEQFYFAEPIQGGTHFFSFVEQHLLIYKHFTQTEEYQTLHSRITDGTAVWYRDALESVLFGYYCKFGETCLADALMVSMRLIFQHRYQTERTRKDSVHKHAAQTQLIQMIDRATSPTFFLAEARNNVRELPPVYLQDLRPVQKSLKNDARVISTKLAKNIVVDSFKSFN